MKKTLINAGTGAAIGITSLILYACINEPKNVSTNQDCTANLKSNAPKEFFSYYKRGETLLTPEDRVTFDSRTFMDNNQLYYEGPRNSFIPEKYLENISEGCKSLPAT